MHARLSPYVQPRKAPLPGSSAHERERDYRPLPGQDAAAIAATAISRYNEPVDLIADPMCGIGTTLPPQGHHQRPPHHRIPRRLAARGPPVPPRTRKPVQVHRGAHQRGRGSPGRDRTAAMGGHRRGPRSDREDGESTPGIQPRRQGLPACHLDARGAVSRRHRFPRRRDRPQVARSVTPARRPRRRGRRHAARRGRSPPGRTSRTGRADLAAAPRPARGLHRRAPLHSASPSRAEVRSSRRRARSPSSTSAPIPTSSPEPSPPTSPILRLRLRAARTACCVTIAQAMTSPAGSAGVCGNRPLAAGLAAAEAALTPASPGAVVEQVRLALIVALQGRRSR